MTTARPIDWRAVQFVVENERLSPDARLAIEEKRMVVRRMTHRLLGNNDSIWSCAAGKVTADELAERMHTTARSIQRIKEKLPPATRRRCPICREDMWVHDADNTVEAHPTSTFDQCVLTGGKWVVIA